MAAVDAAGFPTRPAANELIESAWGGAVRDRLIVRSGYAAWNDPNSIAATLVDLFVVSIPVQSIATRLFITTTWQARSFGAGGGLCTGDVYLLNPPGAALNTVGPWRLDTDGATWSGLAFTTMQAIPAAADPSYKVRFSGSGGPGVYRLFCYSTYQLVVQ